MLWGHARKYGNCANLEKNDVFFRALLFEYLCTVLKGSEHPVCTRLEDGEMVFNTTILFHSFESKVLTC